MSLFNLPIGAMALRGLDAFSAPGSASKLGASIDGDWCGTKVPHPPIPHALEVALRNSRFEQVMLNPQPLPPGPDGATLHHSRFEQVMLNPQPLPPGPDGNVFHQVGRVALDDDWCGTGPRHLPPPPRPVLDVIRQALK
jgi:hypothetical protein